jgi:DNA polymerase-3 subunit beta
MEFVIDQSRFLSALALAQTVADRRGTMPVLANVLLKVDKRGVECRATDMLIAVSERIDAEVVSTGSLTLGVRHLHGVVKTLVEGPVRVRGLDNHWAEIVAGRSEFKLMGMSEADFPTLPDPHDLQLVELPVHAFGDLLTKTLFSVSTDEARANLNGALLECDGKTATMVSTDGHRLTKYTVPLAGPRLTTGVIVPRKGMVEIKRVLDRAQGTFGLAIGEQHLFVRAGELTASVKLSGVTFPPYQAVIPKQRKARATLSRAEFVGALRRAEIMAPEKTATVRVQLDADRLDLTADNPDQGAFHQQLSVEYDGGPLAAGFNARYLLEALEAVDTERVHLDFQGELDPCVVLPVDGPEFLAVVMPMLI